MDYIFTMLAQLEKELDLRSKRCPFFASFVLSQFSCALSLVLTLALAKVQGQARSKPKGLSNTGF